MDKLERLLNLIAALLETPRAMSAEEIHERVPGYPEDSGAAFRRAFERDRTICERWACPCGSRPSPAATRRSPATASPATSTTCGTRAWSPTSWPTLDLAATAVHLDGARGLRRPLEAGRGRGRPGGRPRPRPLGQLPIDANLSSAFQAVAKPHASCASDTAARSAPSTRTASTFQLGRWYLTGFDHLRGDERNFRFDRIEGSITAGAPRSFERPAGAVPGVEQAAWQLGEGEPVVAELLVDADQAAMARHELGSSTVAEERADGSVVLFAVAPVTNRAGFRSLVLGYLDHAEVRWAPTLPTPSSWRGSKPRPDRRPRPRRWPHGEPARGQ